MNTSQADTLVSGCVLGVLVMGMADDYIVKEQNPSFKFFIAVAITGAALAYTADVSPEAAAWLAIIIFIVVLMEEGTPVLKAIQGSNKIGKVQPKGSQHASEFPVIPFTKDKGKKKPRVIKPRDVPVLPVRAKAPARVKINLRKFPVPIFTPRNAPGTSREAEIETANGPIKIPWKELELGTAGAITAVGVVEAVGGFLAAAADEVLRPVG